GRRGRGKKDTPQAIEDAMRRLDDLEVQQRILERETAVGEDHQQRLAAIAEERTQVSARLDSLKSRWEKETNLVQKIREIRTQLEGAVASAPVAQEGGAAAAPAVNPEVRTESLAKLEAELEALQSDARLM